MIDPAFVHETSLGMFIERDGSYISAEISSSQFIVPATFSRTGEPMHVTLPPRTVIVTARSGQKILDVLENNDRQGYRRAFSASTQIATWLGLANRREALLDSEGKSLSGGNYIIGMLSASVATGPYQMTASTDTNRQLGYLIQLDPASYSKARVNTMAGLAATSDILAIPESYLKAAATAITLHELEHGHQNHSRNYGDSRHISLTAEIEADHNSLRSYFNSEFNQFMMDLRALAALNLPTKDGASHLTHIWAEEYGGEQHRLPNEFEAADILAAPKRIQDRINLHIRARSYSDFSRDLLTRDPVHMYGILKLLHERDTFADIPFAGEFIDKYLAAAERLYNPQALQDFAYEEYRTAMTSILDAPEQDGDLYALTPAQSRPQAEL